MTSEDIIIRIHIWSEIHNCYSNTALAQKNVRNALILHIKVKGHIFMLNLIGSLISLIILKLNNFVYIFKVI